MLFVGKNYREKNFEMWSDISGSVVKGEPIGLDIFMNNRRDIAFEQAVC